MRTALSVTLLTIGLFALSAAPATAVLPAVDQYTEQMPDPGGPGITDEDDRATNPDRSGKDGGNGSSDGSGDSDSGVAGTTGSGEPGSGSGGSAALEADGVSAGTGSDQTEETRQIQRSSVPGASGDLGWLFPVLLIGSAVGVGFYLFRQRGNRSMLNP